MITIRSITLRKLAHVARPGITHQGFDGIVGDFHAGPPAVSGRKILQKVSRQQWNIFLALAQRAARRKE